MLDPVLTVESLSRNFGGLAAVRAVSLELHHGAIHAVIGPNGAGKTTLIDLLSGNLKPSSGRIHHQGTDIAGLAPERIARLGIARSYQKSNIFGDFSAFENCRLAAQAALAPGLRCFRPAADYDVVNAAAGQSLAQTGLDGRSGAIASTLSHGEQRQLEIAMTLAGAPKVLLLDEPLSGMGVEESARMTALIARLKASHAILLVEHDMDAVFSLADRLTVMVNGRVLESGAPDAIRRSPAVQEAYLGTLGQAM